MPTLEPRKIPRQGRSRATVDAILDACAEGLSGRGYEALTTNAISERAGVSIGTLYEYFPNREAIAAALAGRAFLRLVDVMQASLRDCLAGGLAEFEGLDHMLQGGVRCMAEEKAVFDVLVREAAFVFELPAVREARAMLLDMSQEVRRTAGNRLNLPMPERDAWLISQMLGAAMREIAILDAPEEQRRRLTRELARLTYRMALGRDVPSEPLATRPALRGNPAAPEVFAPASPNR